MLLLQTPSFSQNIRLENSAFNKVCCLTAFLFQLAINHKHKHCCTISIPLLFRSFPSLPICSNFKKTRKTSASQQTQQSLLQQLLPHSDVGSVLLYRHCRECLNRCCCRPFRCTDFSESIYLKRECIRISLKWFYKLTILPIS